MKIRVLALLIALVGAQARQLPPGAPSSAQQAIGANSPQHSSTDLTVEISKSFVLEHAIPIRRISIANGEIAEAVAVSSTEILLNGKSPGDTSLVLWDSKGNRTAFDVHVSADDSKLNAVRAELSKEVGPDVSMTLEGSNVFLRGTVKDPIAADRAYAIASTLGKAVNLLRVLVPPGEPQILLKVRFADVDREAATQLGLNLFSSNGAAGIGNITTGQYPSNPSLPLSGTASGSTLSQFLNIFYYRPDINLGAVIQALEAKSLLQILAEPNLLATSGRPASFLAGGEFPFPTLQGGGAGVGQITIQFKEFGIRLSFLPTVTPRGTIRLVVTPEVSSLDYGNGLTVSGYTVPGLATRRVQTEVELENGQSFVIAGLLNNQVIDSLNKIPGLSSIPLLGKLFESRSLQKNNTELLVMVTPELVHPIPAGAKPPAVEMPQPFMKGTAQAVPRTPGTSVTGPAPALPRSESLPVEELKNDMQAAGSNGASAASPASGTPPAIVLPISGSQSNPSGPIN